MTKTSSLNIRCANPDDAETLAHIISDTSDGVVQHLFHDLVANISPEKILATALMKGESPYLPTNMTLLTHEGAILALLFAYHAKDHFIPLLMENFLSAKRLGAVRPILESAVENSLYINTIWVEESLRGSGIADVLIKRAVQVSQEYGCIGISLFCWNDNQIALNFYKKYDFIVTREFMQKEIPVEGHHSGGVLLFKKL